MYKKPKYVYKGQEPNVTGEWDVIQSSKVGCTFLLQNEKGERLIISRSELISQFKEVR